MPDPPDDLTTRARQWARTIYRPERQQLLLDLADAIEGLRVEAQLLRSELEAAKGAMRGALREGGGE